MYICIFVQIHVCGSITTYHTQIDAGNIRLFSSLYIHMTCTHVHVHVHIYTCTYTGRCWEYSTFLVVFGTSRFPVSLRWHFARVFLWRIWYTCLCIYILYVLGVFIYFAGNLEFAFLGFVFSCVCMVALCLGACTEMKKIQKVQIRTCTCMDLMYTQVHVFIQVMCIYTYMYMYILWWYIYIL